MTRIAAMFACLALAGCGTPSPADPVSAVAPGASITLGVGEAAALDATVSLRFGGVIEDSRCATDTTCVWAGEVKVNVDILERAKDARTVEMKLNESAKAGNRVVTLQQVEPQPRSNVRIAANGYRATLKIE